MDSLRLLGLNDLHHAVHHVFEAAFRFRRHLCVDLSGIMYKLVYATDYTVLFRRFHKKEKQYEG